MVCRHYFVVDRLDQLADEGDSRPSRVHEHENFRLVSQLHVAIQILWSRCPPRRTVWTNRLVVQSQRVSPFYHDLHLRFCLCLCLSLNVQQTKWYSFSHERNVYRFPEHSNWTFVLSQRVSPFFHDLDLVWLGWLVDLCLSSNFWTQFLHPIMYQGNLWRRSRWFINFFVYDFSIFHPNNFRDTISWECLVKNDGDRSRLIELQSFLLRKFDVDPIHRVLMFLPCFMHVACKTRSFQVDRLRILVFLIYRIYKQKEYCLSFAQILTSWYQTWIDDGMSIDCTSDVMNVLEETVRNNDIVLKRRINKIASWMTLKSSEVKNFSWRISTILKYFLVSSSSCPAASSTFRQTNVENKLFWR